MNYKDRATYIVEACVADRDLALKLLVRIAANNPFAVVRAHEASSVPPSRDQVIVSPRGRVVVATAEGCMASFNEEEVFTPLQQQCIALIRKGKSIDAFKLYKNKTGCRISEAKSEIDRLIQVISID